MDNEDTNRSMLFVFLMGFLVGISILAFTLAFTVDLIPNTDNYNVRVLTKECEKSLPRDQHCIIKAVPKL